MTMTALFNCPMAGCDSFPWDDPSELAAHMATHVFPGATVEAATAPVAPAPVEVAPATVRSFSPGGTRATVAPYNPMNRTPTVEVPPCGWTKVAGEWLIRGPLSVLSGAATVTVTKRNGERKSVDIDPSSVLKDARRRGDRCTMALAAPASAKSEAVEAAGPAPEGFHLVDGTVYKVQVSKSSGHLYAKVLTINGPDEKGSWSYAKGAMRLLSSATVATLEQAEAFGAEFGICMICGALLTNPDSIARGIGPICAGKF
jgi:hypothetical protein